MSGFLESPLPALLGGGLLTAMLVGGWVQTARIWPLFAALGVIGITASLVLLEQAVETERERVTSTLEEIVQVVEQNDLEGLLGHIHPEKLDIRQQARREFPKYDFSEISIRSNLEVTTRSERKVKIIKPEIDGEKYRFYPATARVTFNVVADGSIADLGLEDTTVRRYVELDFEKYGGRWVVVKYAHFEPLRGMRDQYSDMYGGTY